MKVNKFKNRGARLSTAINLPINYHWKVLGALVEDLKAYLSEKEVVDIQSIIRTRDFSAYLSLSVKWSLQSMNSAVDTSAFGSLKAKYAIGSLLKKYLPKPDKNLDRKALDKLLEAEEICRNFNDELSSYFKAGDTSYTRDILAYMRGFLRQLLGDQVPVRAIVKEAKHGPGANLDTQDGDTTVFSKYSNIPYSCTPKCIGYAVYMIQSDERWLRALKHSYCHAKSIDEADINWTEFWDYHLKIVDYNRIAFVPKTAEISRPIAIEPALNLMLQLGVDKFVRTRLKRFGIDLNSQEINQRLSRIGSKYGIYATIDLSSASDLISLSLCEMVLPAEWYQFLCSLRSERGSLGGDEYLSYQKISSMGNGYTFVLESAIFAAAIFAAYKIKKQPLFFGVNAAVFGDDLIVRSDMYEEVKDVLELCGFRLNENKSFCTGPVRESCGADWFQGLPVRPIFLKTPPSDLQDLFVDHNIAKRFLETSFGIVESNVCETILKWIKPHQRYYGPLSDQVFDAWLHTSKAGLYDRTGYRFTSILRYVKEKKLSPCFKYGYRYFIQLGHNLRGPREKTQFYSLKRIKLETGSRFAVNSKGFTVKRKPVNCQEWQSTYYVILPLLG